MESAIGIGHTSSGAEMRWDPASGASRHSTEPGSPASKGTIGTSGYNALTCSQLKGAKYTATFAPVANGEVFLVKTAGDHLAKVVVTLTPGNTAPTLRWQSYAP